MNLNDAPAGYAFEGDYPEVYTDSLSELQGLLHGQLTELETNDPIRDAANLGFLRGRRCSQRDLAQIDVPDSESPGVLLARREIVISAEEWSDPRVREALWAAGYNDRGQNDGPFVRLVNNRTRKDLSYRNIASSGLPNTIAVLAAVGKGVGGPDPVASPIAEPGDFASYAIPGAERPEGNGPVVAIIDTGIPGKQEDGLPTMERTDGWLDSVPRYDNNRDLLDHLPQRDGYLDFQTGHGTCVAGIVQRVAPTAQIRVYRAADTDGFADDAGIANALLRAVEDGAQIINLSLGLVTPGNQPPPALKAALRKITDEHGDDVVIVAAAGNSGTPIPYWPAAFDEVEAVAALVETEAVGDGEAARRSDTFTAAPWSSHGDHVDFWTVAEGVRSTFVTGYESPIFDDTPAIFPRDAWVLWSGTSFAAPQIAGAIARISHELGMKPRDAVKRLHERGAEVDGQAGKAMRILSGIPRP